MTRKPFGHLLLGVCGSSAATAVDQLVTDARRHATQVTVIATPTAAKLFLPQLSVPVYTDTDWAHEPLHITLLGDSDALIIAPATATTIAKAATGLADTLLTALILTHGPGVHFQPSMNQRMWTNPAVIRNIDPLRRDGHHVLQPAPTAALTNHSSGSAVGPIPGDVVAAVAAHIRGRRQSG